MALKAAQLNYPVHKKELLAIICALQKWHSDLLGIPITIYMDHWTLENFNHQKDLLHRQAHWQEFLAQYDHQITYILDEWNCIANALSRLPNSVDAEAAIPVAALLMVVSDPSLLKSIMDGYKTDPFCAKITKVDKSLEGIYRTDGLLYIGDWLVISQTGPLQEDLFHLAHNNLGHFGFKKSYKALQHDYYWPNMHKDLSKTYILACVDCQCNRGHTTKLVSPLHPLPVLDQCSNSITIDFIDPCLQDDGFDCIITITNQLGVDIQITPTHMNISAEHCSTIF